MKVSVELPDTASLRDVDQDYLKAALVTTLYHVGKLSEKEACMALGVSRRTFEELLPRFGFSVLADDQETLDTELHAWAKGGVFVSNTGPLISLEKLAHGYHFIRQLYDKLIIPPAVLAEVAQGQFETPHAYLQHYDIVDLVEVRAVTQRFRPPEAERLHEGEIQAICLALELKLPLLIEETVGRRVAQNTGLSISGMAGQIMAAFRQGIISPTEAGNQLEELFQAGRINRKIYEALVVVLSKD